jgi:hypothetical protein
LQFLRHFHLDGRAARNKMSPLDQSADNTEGIVKRALRLLENELV